MTRLFQISRPLLLLGAVALLLALMACGGGPPAPPALAYDLPAGTSLTYEMADTTYVDIDAMGQTMQTVQASSGIAEVTMEPVGDGVRVTMTFPELSASLTQPMAGTLSADESALKGSVVFTLDRRGHVQVEEVPDVSGTLEQLFEGGAVAHTFFPRLPGRGVGAGDTWTDTIAFSAEIANGEMESTMILTYTAEGNATVDGRNVLRIAVEGDATTEVTASMQGADIFQSAVAGVQGHVLWDTNAGVMVEQVTEMEGDGTIDVSMAPEPMPIQLRGRSIIRLKNE